MKTHLLLALTTVLSPLALMEDSCGETPQQEPMGALHSEPGVCDGHGEIAGADGRTADAGWLQLLAVPDTTTLVVAKDDCGSVSESCGARLTAQGQISLGNGSCDAHPNGVSTSGINLDSGVMKLCSTGQAIFVITHDDCGGLTDQCPSGFQALGRIHAGDGTCDGRPRARDWQDQPLVSGWLTLCVEEEVARLELSSDDCG